MAVGKRFEVYQESHNLPQLSGTDAYNPISTRSSHTVKIYSLKGTRCKIFNNYMDRPFSDQLWSQGLGLLASSFSLPILFRERLRLSHQLNPYTIPYSLNGTNPISIQSTFQHLPLMPEALLQKQKTVTSFTAYDRYN